MTNTQQTVHQQELSFLQYPATQKLQQLASHPIDLSEPGNLNPQRIEQFVSSCCGYRLLYATERVTEEVIKTLVELSQQAHVIDKMKQMQDGVIMNLIEGAPSENRMVLHTATRDFFDNPNQAPAAKEATAKAKKEIDKLKVFIDKIDREGRFTDYVTVGIGGSDLGPRAHYIALKSMLKKGRNVHFISNIDPDDGAMVLRGLDLKKTMVAVISKTGTTLETCSNEEFVRSFFIKAGLNPKDHFISITGEGSPLDNKEKYLESFYMWDWIGGRYSTTSMVGAVTLSFAFGFDVFWDFLKGVNTMDKAALNPDIRHNLPLLGALLAIWNRNFLHYPTLALIPYSQALSRYSAHIQQVEMESNGKHIDKHGHHVDFETGPVIWGEPGTNGQHSFYQLIHQGTNIIPLEFIGFKESQCGQDAAFQGTTLQQKLLSNLIAQSIALATGQKSDNPNKEFLGNRPSHMLIGNKLTPNALGRLLGYFEHKAAFQGFVWGINSFDQEGVQLGKVLAKKVIDRFGNPSGAAYPVGDAYIKQFNLLSDS